MYAKDIVHEAIFRVTCSKLPDRFIDDFMLKPKSLDLFQILHSATGTAPVTLFLRLRFVFVKSFTLLA